NAAGIIVRLKKGFDFGAKFLVGGAGLIKIGGAFTWRKGDGGIQDFADLLPLFRFQVAALRLSSRNSQARAVVQSRFTVDGEMPRTSAVSSTVSPPKTFNSTTRLCCSSIWARLLSASSRSPTPTSRTWGFSSASWSVSF